MSQVLPKIQDWFDSRTALRVSFLGRIGWGEALSVPVGDDCAFRRYFRMKHSDGRTAILMETVPDGTSFITPGHNMNDFIRIGAYLTGMGLHAPAIYERDITHGYLLLEDFGATSFKAALASGHDRRGLYELATDVLCHLRVHAREGDIVLPRYYESHVHTARRRLVDWYMPCQDRVKNPDGLVEDYLAVWDSIEADLPPVKQGFLHIDYHFENLMWMPERDGLMRAGILDYQGAMMGPVSYDLANLLEDARVDVPEDIRASMLDRFCDGMSAQEEHDFRAWYRVLATQFHCRVLGQFIRLALRDGKFRYIQHMPRVSRYIERALGDPVLAPLQSWLTRNDVRLDQLPDIDESCRAFIRDDAF